MTSTAQDEKKSRVGTPSRQTQDTWTVAELLNALTIESPKEFDFRELYSSDILTEPLVKTGALKFSPPAQLEKHIYTPHHESFIVNQDNLRYTKVAEDIARSLSLSDYPPLRVFVEGLRAIFSGDLTTLNQLYHTKIKGTKSEWSLTIIPKDEELHDTVASIVFQGKHHDLSTLVILEANGNHTTLDFARTEP